MKKTALAFVMLAAIGCNHSTSKIAPSMDQQPIGGFLGTFLSPSDKSTWVNITPGNPNSIAGGIVGAGYTFSATVNGNTFDGFLADGKTAVHGSLDGDALTITIPAKSFKSTYKAE